MASNECCFDLSDAGIVGHLESGSNRPRMAVPKRKSDYGWLCDGDEAGEAVVETGNKWVV